VDRVLASEAKGRWFDSSQPRQFIAMLPNASAMLRSSKLQSLGRQENHRPADKGICLIRKGSRG